MELIEQFADGIENLCALACGVEFTAQNVFVILSFKRTRKVNLDKKIVQRTDALGSCDLRLLPVLCAVKRGFEMQERGCGGFSRFLYTLGKLILTEALGNAGA